MDKLINSKWEVAAAEDVKAAIEEIRELIDKYNWQGCNVYPYSYPINIVKFLDQFENYENYTFDSKQVALDELNGLIEHCVNPWLEYENKPKVKIKKFSDGKIFETTKEVAEDLVEAGAVEIV